MEHSFICCCVKLIFQKFSTILRKNIHFHFPVRIFTAPPVSPDMQNTPPNFEILAVYFDAKRWYINFVRTFCGQRTCIHAAVSKRRDNFDREVIGVFWYHCVMERLYHPACGAYTSFGIAACSTSHGRHRKLRFISDVSVDPVRVLRLAARCTACQLDPSSADGCGGGSAGGIRPLFARGVFSVTILWYTGKKNAGGYHHGRNEPDPAGGRAGPP